MPSAAEVGEILLASRPDRPIIPLAAPKTPLNEGPSVPPIKPRLKPGPGRMVVNRLARLESPAGSDWRLLRFESDNTLQEPPLRILPNEWLERMESAAVSAARAGSRLVFHVSGEVVRYRENEYILIRQSIREPEMNQF